MELRLTSSPDRFATFEARREFVLFLATTIEGHAAEDSFLRPFNPNKGDTHYWTLDRGNDWKVLFPAGRPDSFEVLYRYNSPACDKESALAGWLAIRLGAEIVGPPRECAPFPARIPTF